MLKRKINSVTQFKEIRPNSQTLTVVQHRLHIKAATFLTNFLSKYSKQIAPQELCVLIKGHPGSGKTFLVRDIARQMGMRILEFNSSHHRDAKTINKILKDATKNFTVGEINSMVVFIDDVDVVLETDVGFVKALNGIMAESKCPVIMACTNQPKELRSKNLRVICLEPSIRYLDVLNTCRDSKEININNIEILYLFRYYAGNLNYIFSNFMLTVSLI